MHFNLKNPQTVEQLKYLTLKPQKLLSAASRLMLEEEVKQRSGKHTAFPSF